MSNALRRTAAEQSARKGATPQMERTPGRTDEVQNNAGGFVFKVSDKARLERFLILGVDGGTYYVGEAKFTADAIAFLKEFIRKDERAFIDTVVDVRVNNRAAKQSPAIYAIALVLSEGQDKAYAREAVAKMNFNSTQLFEFAEYVKAFGGWGRAKRGAVADWYETKDAGQLAYQAVKYRQRNGWTHRDLFRLSHPKGVDQRVGNFILGKTFEGTPDVDQTILDAFAQVQRATSVREVKAVLDAHKNLPWETIPTQFLTDAEVWKTLFYNGALGQTALIRNITRFAKVGAFDDLVFAGDVAKRLADEDAIRKGRVHPVQYANALGIYVNGPMVDRYAGYGSYDNKQAKTWSVNAKVNGGLEAGFYNSFKTIEPANKPTMVSVDVSGSMTWGAPAGLVGMNYLQAAAVMAMVTVRTEPYVVVNAFSTNLKQVNVSDTDNFKTVVDKFNRISMGGTDVSQPMVFATANKLQIDTFQVYTDNETWAGRIKPSEALVKYRKSSGREARLAVVALAGTEYSVADPTDRGQMDFSGFDSAAPKVMADFSAGRI